MSEPDPKDAEIQQLRRQLDACTESVGMLTRRLDESENRADALGNALTMMTLEHGKEVQAHAKTEATRRQTYNALMSYMEEVHELSDKLAAAQ